MLGMRFHIGEGEKVENLTYTRGKCLSYITDINFLTAQGHLEFSYDANTALFYICGSKIPALNLIIPFQLITYGQVMQCNHNFRIIQHKLEMEKVNKARGYLHTNTERLCTESIEWWQDNSTRDNGRH